jgi:hypothetical protein
MKLYKQQQTPDGDIDKLDLIMESDNLETLKTEAMRLAKECSCLDHIWMFSDDLKNYELSVGDKYKFIIRDW